MVKLPEDKNMSKVTKQSVALLDRDREIIGGLAKEMGTSFSGALRVIVREWHIMKNMTIYTAPPTPTTTQEE